MAADDCGRCNDDGDADDVGEDRASHCVDAFGRVLGGSDATVGDGGGLVELHVWRHRRADERDAEEEELLVGDEMRPQCVRGDRAPVGMAEQNRDRVGEKRERKYKEEAFRVPVGAEDHERPDTERGDGDGQVTRDAEELEGGAYAGEFGDDQAEVRDDKATDGECRKTERELLPNQRHETLARVRAEAGRHLLHHDERDRHEHHEERAAIDELMPAAFHTTAQYSNNRVECDHGRRKARLRPMRGLKRDRSARVIMRGHALMQNIRRGHYELGVQARHHRRIEAAFGELVRTI